MHVVDFFIKQSKVIGSVCVDGDRGHYGTIICLSLIKSHINQLFKFYCGVVLEIE